MQSSIGRVAAAFALVIGFIAVPVMAQSVLMMPDSTNNRLVTFNAFNGALLNSSVFPLQAGTPIHAMQVNQEIWVSEQIGDRVVRFDFTGNTIGVVSGGLDNVRGMEQVGNTIYVASTGTGGGAPGRHVAMYDPFGASVGTFSTPASSGFGILSHQGGLLVSSDAANDDIHRYSLAGASQGTFHNTTSVNFAEQMDIAPNGDVLTAAFSSNIVARLDPTTGAFISSFAASGARGVAQLGNGNVLWTSGAGAFVFDVATGGSTQVYTGGGRFLDELVIPEPHVGATLAIGISMLVRARRR